MNINTWVQDSEVSDVPAMAYLRCSVEDQGDLVSGEYVHIIVQSARVVLGETVSELFDHHLTFGAAQNKSNER